ncbi:MAG: hypothetical protein GWP08_14555, partial [Nitrospiraceae bacterium]|nr:hypothetical protein [Nitrospiraceae bacterium]
MKPKAISTARKPEASREKLPLDAIEAALRDRLARGDEGVIDMVDTLLVQAVQHRASDVHVEPWNDCVAVRYRIDGLLHDAAQLPQEHHRRIIGRIKVLARIATYHKDTPQDGRVEPEATPCGKAMRVSTFPTVQGEKVVVRLLDTDPALFSLDVLGFSPAVVAALRAIIARPQGTLLLTGPASSGKTTTIYALLKEIIDRRSPSAHVVTIEDPVECRLDRVAQTQINAHAGFTFEAALRAVVRQDPEVIMLGEIRDPETARAAIQAGLTGHFVISTIHSGTAAGVFARLLDMGIEPYLIASAVTGVLAQRLVRRNCPHCTEGYVPDPTLRNRFGLADPGLRFKHGAGCAACEGIGYLGRTAVGEILPVDADFTDLVLERPRTHVLHEAALNSGMRPLADDAARRVVEADTTIEEVARVLPPPGAEPTEPASPKHRGGFMLLELVAAFFVLTIGVLGTIATYHYGGDRIREMR